ncbi:ABC transporter permease [Pseudoduganella sp. GCM10020061]|uniref:ABC transporter permease n=1 Tax=Pseudoduganella sp. GCM10020061 TaxID=3317345 RepID=UPI00362E228D
MHTALAIAGFTIVEARRNGLAWVFAAAALAALGAALFAGTLALTEVRAMRAAIGGPVLRLAAVFMVAGFVATSIAREKDDRVRDVLLSLPITRARFAWARLAGFCAVALVVGLLCGLVALAFGPIGQVALWTLSLACELMIVAAFALFAATGLANVVAALAATLGFYLLARMAAALQLLGQERARSQLETIAADAVSAVLPHLDAFARTEWLAYGGAGAADAGHALLQAAIYVVLLGAACALDLQREDIE